MVPDFKRSQPEVLSGHTSLVTFHVGDAAWDAEAIDNANSMMVGDNSLRLIKQCQ